jgi:hypothetical protein
MREGGSGICREPESAGSRSRTANPRRRLRELTLRGSLRDLTPSAPP